MSTLTPKQLEAVSGLAKGLTTRQIAKNVGVSSRTVERWQKLPEFVAALAQIQNEVSRKVSVDVVESVASVNSRLQNLALKSLNCLEEIVDNREARSGDRIQASKIILSEWQRMQTPVLHEITAVETLVKSGFLPYGHLEKLQKAVAALTEESQAIFQHPSTSVVGSEALN